MTIRQHTAHPRPRKSAAAIAATALSALLLTACGEVTDTGETAAAEGSASPVAASAEDCRAQTTESTRASLDIPEGWRHVVGESDFSALEAEPNLPATVTDGTGTTVEVEDASKIIAAGDGIAATLGALGLSEHIFAAPDNSTAPEAVCAPEQFEFSKDTGTEGLLAMNGTLFIGDNTKRHGEVAQQFRDAATAAVVVDDQQTQVEKIQAIADYVGVPDAGAGIVAEVNADFAEAKESLADAGLADTRVIQVTATGAGGQNSVAGTGTPGTELVEELGLVSAGNETGLRGFSREFSNEGLIAAAPDVILIAESDLAEWGGEEGLYEAFPTLQETPAGQDNRIIVMPDSQIRYTSPDLGAGALALAQALVEQE